MLSWPADPVVRFKFARALRWSEVPSLLIALACMSLLQYLPVFEWVPWENAAGFVAVVALVGSVPAAAGELAMMDLDARLDQLRLSGRSPSRLLISTIVASTAIPLALSLSVFLAWRAYAGFTLESIAIAMALFGGSLALSLLVLALPRTTLGTGARQAALGLGFPVLVAAGLVFLDPSPLREFLIEDLRYAPPVSGTSAAWILTALAIPTALASWRPAIAAVRHPAATGARTIVPARVAAALAAAVTLALIGALWIISASGWGAWPNVAAAVSMLPLVAGALTISMAAQEDRRRGRLDALRVAPIPGRRMVASLVVSHWSLFAAASLAAQAAALWGPGLGRGAMAFTIVLLIAAAPVPLMEGWDRAVPLTYMVPIVVIASLLVSDLVQGDLIQGGNWKTAAPLRVLLLFWIPWVCAVRIWRQPDARPLAGWTGTAAVACLTIVAMWPAATPLWPGASSPGGTEFLGAALLVSVGFFTAPAPAAADWWRPLATAAIVSAVMLWPSEPHPVRVALAMVTPALAWFAGLRIHQWLGNRYVRQKSGVFASASIVTRLNVALFAIFGSRVLANDGPALVRNVAGLPGDLERTALFAFMLLVAAVAVEAAYRARHWIPAVRDRVP